MIKKIAGLMVLSAALVAPLSAQTADPKAGTFDFNTADPSGTPIVGTITLTDGDEGWTGSMMIQGQQIPFGTVGVDGDEVSIVFEFPQAGEVTIEIEFDGPDMFAGSWFLNMDTGEITGRRQGTGDDMS